MTSGEMLEASLHRMAAGLDVYFPQIRRLAPGFAALFTEMVMNLVVLEYVVRKRAS